MRRTIRLESSPSSDVGDVGHNDESLYFILGRPLCVCEKKE